MLGFRVKSAIAAVTVAAMIGSSAFAADGTLTSGKPAGVRPAQQIGTGTLLIAGASAAILIGVGIAVSQSGQNNTSGNFSGPTTTSTTPP